ncbi:MAG: phytanoyl-CoA dioxygenase family protein [Halioglobus sp.]
MQYSPPRLSAALVKDGPANSPKFVAGTIPEIEVTELTVPVLQAAIQQTGYLIVRGFFEDAQASMMRDCIDHAFASRADALGEAPGAADSPWYYNSPQFSGGGHVAYSQRQNSAAPKRSGATRVIDSPRSTLKLLDLYASRGMADLVKGYFDEEAVIAARKWVFRLIEPIPAERESIGGGWHQDGQFMGEGVSALNLWVALSECGQGTAAPGIALLPKRIEEILEYGTRGARMDWVVGSELVEELAADAPIVCPHFDPGDALFFDHYSLHRSGHGAHQSERRYALESWFYSRSGTAGNVVLPMI